MKKSELTAFIKEEIKSTLTTEGDIPTIDIRSIGDDTNFDVGDMTHSSENGKMDIMKKHPMLAKAIALLLQKEIQKTFRNVIHSTLGEPFGLDEASLATEGVWSRGTDVEIQQFITAVDRLKSEFYDVVGSDDVFNGLDQAISAAQELATTNEATYKVSADKVDSIKDKVSDEDTVEVTEEEDKEPSKADLKATKGLAKAKEELAQLTKQMKSLARDYKKAEGAEKEKIVADLKKKTKLKKELEAIIDK